MIETPAKLSLRARARRLARMEAECFRLMQENYALVADLEFTESVGCAFAFDLGMESQSRSDDAADLVKTVTDRFEVCVAEFAVPTPNPQETPDADSRSDVPDSDAAEPVNPESELA